jgi:serine/threonine-protein kinase RsbW
MNWSLQCGDGIERGDMLTTIRLPATASSAAKFRHQIASELSQSAISTAVLDDVLLVATELISNAIRHAEPLGDGQVTVSWRVQGREVTVEVSDGGGGGEPRVRQVSTRDTYGRGLALVEALATRWGVEHTSTGTTVWACVTD